MAIIHRAELTPSKLDALRKWLTGRDWCPGDAAAIETIGAYRIDDPAGEVGIEGHLLRAADGTVLHVPVTYRAAALQGADDHLIATMEHSVLGRRWVYDAAHDPVAVAALTEVIASGAAGADIELQGDPVRVSPTPVQVVGSGVASADPLSIFHVIDGTRPTDGAVLTGTWDGQSVPVALARR